MKRELIDDILDPDFIYGECSRKKYHLKLKKRVPTLYCCKCDKETAVPSKFLKN